ncbi:unnamed protein product, partial [Rotaria sp. Silwood2]
CEQADKLQP